ncbi:MAG TPA: secretin N-terminal domain-containing protein [Thermoanaerobaculia bacterium]|nr:secretin N-terminal domain-containing protein [Thermoanaerobaculia bacterium]
MNRRLAWALAPLLVVLVGCAGFADYRRAQIAEQEGDWDEAVLRYLELVEQDPGRIEYRAALLRAKIRASQQHFELGRRFHEAGALERALVEYRQAVELDPTNQYAFVELSKVREELTMRQEARGSLQTLDEMKREARARAQPPLLEPRSPEPISLEFPQSVAVKDIYRALGKAYGINVLFDPNLKDQEIAIELEEVTAQDALEILMRAAGHFYKVLDEHTILIAADTPQNRRAYEDLVIQTFFLSNAEVKDVMTMLRTLVDAKKIASNDRLNAIIMRDSADRVKVAERIIETNDKARAEVVIDVELLQVNSQKVRDLGVSLSSYSVTQSLDVGQDAALRLSDLEFLNQNHWAITIPNFLYSFIKSNTEAEVLARPQLRISEGEKASLHIGDRVPIPTTTFNTANTIGGNIVPITSFQYTDIGIKINIEPRVHHNLEVTLKLTVEVSNLAGSVTGASGQEQPIIGTRNIQTTIRLKDGETNFLAGLLRTDETSSDTGVPGLSEIPVVGRLFSRTNRNAQRTDVILTMTPHIIRRSDIIEADLLPIWVGTEQNITFRAQSPRVESEVEGPFDEGTSAAERVRELIRQRVQELPRGLQDRAEPESGEEPPEPPPGVELVPGLPPSDIFAEPEPEEIPEEEPEIFEEEIPEEEPELRSGLAAPAPQAPALAAAAASAEGVDLRLVPQDLRVRAGDRFDVRVELDSGLAVSHLPLVMVFDPAVLEVAGWKAGDALGGGDEAQVLVAEAEPGRVLVGASRLGERPGVRGQGTVVTITFTAVGGGSSPIGIVEPRALGAGLDELTPVTVEGARVTVHPESEKPERPARQES